MSKEVMTMIMFSRISLLKPLALICFLFPLVTKGGIIIGEEGVVTIRMKAPSAEKVSFHSWEYKNKNDEPEHPLRKNDRGIWETTLEPVLPGNYLFSMKVDGQDRLLPGAKIVGGLFSERAQNVLEIPEKDGTPCFDQKKSVPSGVVSWFSFYSDRLETERRVHVYTPPGYNENSARLYDSLVLLHGGGSDDGSWIQLGRVNLILDNLLAEGKIDPMVVIMPDGIIDKKKFPPLKGESDREHYIRISKEVFTPHLFEELLSEMGKRYRLNENPSSRYLAGLSMGGTQAFDILQWEPDYFDFIGIFSKGGPANPAKHFPDFFEDAGKINETIELLYLACGQEDFIVHFSTDLHRDLKKAKIDHEWIFTEGDDHTWDVWRNYLKDFLLRIEQSQEKSNSRLKN